MPKWIPISEELKNKILRDIKENGLSVPKASQEYWIWTKSIYNWLNKNITENNAEKFN